jgi:hypothetical protein
MTFIDVEVFINEGGDAYININDGGWINVVDVYGAFVDVEW